MTSLVLHGVRPYGEGPDVSVRIDEGIITEIGESVDISGDVQQQHFESAVLLPGFVDVHTHVREPGREDTETIASGSAAAAKGGFTAIFAMANTHPVADNSVITDAVWRKGQQIGMCDVHPVGAVTMGLQGEKLTEMGEMARGEGQVRIFSDDGKCVDHPLVMRRALEYSVGLNVLIAQHAEEPRLTEGAVAHEGEVAARLGLAGWPRSAEESIVARDVILARDAGAALHICHVSTAGTVEIIRWAKAQGIAVTAEVTPHHLILTDATLETYDGVFRVNPPLREASDVQALRQAVVDGIVDCVATDHAPHSSQEKCCQFDQARPGMLGLETAMAIVAKTLVEPGLLSWRDVARIMSEKPAEIGKLTQHGQPIAVDAPANLTVIDPGRPWVVDPEKLASLSRNTPYTGQEFSASVQATILRGKFTALRGEPQW